MKVELAGSKKPIVADRLPSQSPMIAAQLLAPRPVVSEGAP